MGGGGMGGVWGTEYRNLAWAEEHGPEDLGAEFGKRQRGLNEEEPSTPVFPVLPSVPQHLGGGRGGGTQSSHKQDVEPRENDLLKATQ